MDRCYTVEQFVLLSDIWIQSRPTACLPTVLLFPVCSDLTFTNCVTCSDVGDNGKAECSSCSYTGYILKDDKSDCLGTDNSVVDNARSILSCKTT